MISSPNIFNAKIITYTDFGFKTFIKAKLENTEKLIKLELLSDIFKEFELGINSNIKIIFPTKIMLAKNECALRLGVENELFGKIISKLNNEKIYSCSKEFSPSENESKLRYVKINAYNHIFSILLSEEEIKALSLSENDEVILQLNASEIKLGILE